MKTRNILVIITAACLAFSFGCGKQESADKAATAAAEKTTTGAANASLSDAAKQAATDVRTAVEAQKPGVEKALQDASKAAENTAAEAEAQFQRIIGKVKSHMAEQRYQEALAVVQQLASLKFTPEQQKVLDGIKLQIQEGLAKKTASDAASSAANVLDGKK